jgi:hypothetical protein
MIPINKLAMNASEATAARYLVERIINAPEETVSDYLWRIIAPDNIGSMIVELRENEGVLIVYVAVADVKTGKAKRTNKKLYDTAYDIAKTMLDNK